MVKNNGWPSPARLWAIPSCCFWTSRPRDWIPARDASCGKSSALTEQQGRTILITTHYLDEAERLCDRVAIVDHGKVIAEGTPHDLIVSLGGEHMIEFTLDERSQNGSPSSPANEAAFLRLPSVRSVHYDNGRTCLSVSEPHKALPALLDCLGSMQMPLASLTTRHASLEDVFVKLAGRRLEDEEPPAP